MDGESKPAQEGSLIEAHLPRQEVTSSFLPVRKTNPDPLRELKPIPKPGERLGV